MLSGQSVTEFQQTVGTVVIFDLSFFISHWRIIANRNNQSQMKNDKSKMENPKTNHALLSQLISLPGFSLLRSRTHILSLRSSLVLLVKLSMPARQRDLASVDKHMFDLGSNLERIAVGNNQICDLALLY